VTYHRARPLAVVALASAMSLALPMIAFAGADGGGAGVTVAPTAPTGGPAVRGAGTHADALLVRIRPGASGSAVDALLSAAGATQVGRLDQIDTRVVTAAAGRTRAAVRLALLASPSVASVEDDVAGTVTLEPNDALWSNEWSARKVRADRAWNYTTGDGGPVIAVLDTGVKAGHVDLSGRVLAGWDFVNADANPADDNGHGTMVAGVAAGLGNNAVGIAGTCWGCRILPVKVADLYGNVKWSNAAAGLIWATDNGATVINMSFGKTTGSDTLAAGVAYAHSHGVVVVAAAGNEGNKARFYPASYPGVLSVAATNSSDHLYSWSTRGSWVRLAAPGCTWTTKRGGGWGSFCGTSASAPIVAGIAGLALALKPDATQSDLEQTIIDTAVFVTSAIGGGRVDAYAVLHKLSPKPGGGNH
jgi:thermitase